MADRYAAWKVRKDEEKQRNNIDSGRGGGGRGCFKVSNSVCLLWYIFV